MICCLFIVLELNHIGRIDLARPILYSIGVVGVAIAIKWKLSRYVWFWTTLTVIVALHVVLILSVRWTTQWVPVFVFIPFCIADLYAILAILSVVEKFLETPKTSER